jgi:uncharacterized protein (TIGR03083 family)
VSGTITARWARGGWGRAGRRHARDGSSLGCMVLSWDNSRRAFTDAADWFVRTAALVGDRWGRPGLGEWDVRALVGHTSRSLVTVETYLARPAAAVEVASATDYFRATRAAAAGAAVAARGRDAGTALGSDPAAAVAELAARVVALIDDRDGTELVTTIAGGMRLGDYLPTRTFELAIHTADLATALGVPPDVPATAAAQALGVVTGLALADGLAGPLLLAATGRPGLPAGFSVL